MTWPLRRAKSCACAARRLRHRARQRQHGKGPHDDSGSASGVLADTPEQPAGRLPRTGAPTWTAPRWSPRSCASAAATWRCTATTSRSAPGRWTPRTAASSRRLRQLAGERGIRAIGLNDSAGAYVPAGVGGPRRLRRGVRGAAQDQRRGPEHHVHVRVQRGRRLLPRRARAAS